METTVRILVAAYPSRSHFLPLVPLAWAFQSAGHEVRVASHFTFADDIAAAGLTPVPLGGQESFEARNRDGAYGPKDAAETLRYAGILGVDGAERERWIEFYQYALVAIGDYVRPGQPDVEELISFAREWRPHLVLWEPLFACAPVAARVSGAAHARLLLGSDSAGWALDLLAARRADLVAAGLRDNPLADLIAPLADEHGVTVDNDLLLGRWTIEMTPADYGPPTSLSPIRMRYVPYSGAEAVPSWLREPPRRPRVVLSLGDSTRRFIPGDWDRTPRILQAVADLDIEVVATLNALQMRDLDRVPDNVRPVEWVPLTQVLPTCSAIIHHGGAGTFAAARAYRVPQLVCDSGESLLIRQDDGDPGDAGTGLYQLGREFGVREKTKTGAPRWLIPAKNTQADLVTRYLTRHNAGGALDYHGLTIPEIGKRIIQVVSDPAYQSGADSSYESWLTIPRPSEVASLFESLLVRD